MQDRNDVFDRISEALLTEYSNFYYVNAVTHNYYAYITDQAAHTIELEKKGEDFFSSVVVDAKKIIFEDDMHYFTEKMRKDNLLLWVKKGIMESFKYRIMIEGHPVWHSLQLIRGTEEGDAYFVLGVKNIDEEYRASLRNEDELKKTTVYNQIASSLASHYDVVYYINVTTGGYVEFTSRLIYGALKIKEEGKDFFTDAAHNTLLLVHEDDRDRVAMVLEKDYFITALEVKKVFTVDYRLVIEGVVQNMRLTGMWANDRMHLIIGVECRDEAVRMEQEHLEALNLANERARRDELTGTKNKTAYKEYVEVLQKSIEKKDCNPFAIVVCDINDLKHVNDTRGHKAGDDYIRVASRMVCRTFVHSPVFRFGGDEFVIIINGEDYPARVELLAKLRKDIIANLYNDGGPILATGMATYDPEDDDGYSSVFERADSRMYVDKRELKEKRVHQETYSRSDNLVEIPEERRKKVDNLFNALEIAGEGAYVYLCDIKYDFSRWSQTAVDLFGLPSKYMYGAGSIWEEHIHPDDRSVYHEGIQSIFAGASSEHDMQYRTQRADGVYETCSCRGLVMFNEKGEPEYFCGTIKSHEVTSSMDDLTGLRNEYGFFEDLSALIRNRVSANITIIGISRFVEINEIYGYMFGNIVIQKFGRFLFETVANSGKVYRIDGTKFAVISQIYSQKEIARRYRDIRKHFRDGFSVENKTLILDLNAANFTLDNFNVDVQTVYTCLSFAYDESKEKRQGDLVQFQDKLTDENRQKIEKFHVIRSSIIDKFSGFVLFYQPVVDAMTEKLIGAEALIRWQNKEYGMIMPDQFISLLEKDSLFPELGRWIIKKALLDTKNILKHNPDFVISVNLSYTQLEKPDFPDMVVEVLKEADFPPGNLCLEVTERCRMLDLNLLKNVISRLKAEGVKFALDDFGTGFSSIGLLKHLPFDTIKIDRSFVMHIEEDSVEKELVENIIRAASIFDAKVCVEGIETPGMRDILQKFKVKSFQGYYYSKPLPYDKFIEWGEQKK